MLYIQQDSSGKPIAIHNNRQSDTDQEVPLNDPKVLALLADSGKKAAALEVLAASDIELIRVIEDLAHLLIEKQVLLYTELPEAAQKKLQARCKIRENLNCLSKLIDNDDRIF